MMNSGYKVVKCPILLDLTKSSDIYSLLVRLYRLFHRYQLDSFLSGGFDKHRSSGYSISREVDACTQSGCHLHTNDSGIDNDICMCIWFHTSLSQFLNSRVCLDHLRRRCQGARGCRVRSSSLRVMTSGLCTNNYNSMCFSF